jgi:DNA-binding transcriptional MerR regulator
VSIIWHDDGMNPDEIKKKYNPFRDEERWEYYKEEKRYRDIDREHQLAQHISKLNRRIAQLSESNQSNKLPELVLALKALLDEYDMTDSVIGTILIQKMNEFA